jgi:hypothetical protein
MYILVSDFFQKNIIYMYLILEIRIVREEFLAFNHVTMFFQNKSDDYLYIQYTYLYIRNLENLRLKLVFYLYLCWHVENTK